MTMTAAMMVTKYIKAADQDCRHEAASGQAFVMLCGQVTREFYDEVICELASLFCRHQPRRGCVPCFSPQN